jgi:cytochrome c-type biogenesis protein CcmH/NrfG
MTYARQLRDYENAVLQKRLDELADDEIQALMEEIELEDAPGASKTSSE